MIDKDEYEGRVFSSDLHQTAKLVLLAYLRHVKQQTLKEVWPSYTTIGEYAGVSRETARKVAEELCEAGWLTKGSLRKNNVQAYGFGEAVDTTDNLRRRKRRVAVESIDNLNRSGKAQVVDTKSQVVDSDSSRLSIEGTQVVDTVSTGNYKETKELETTMETKGLPTPTAAVGVDDVPSSPLLTLVEDDSPLPPIEGGTPSNGEDIKDNDHEEEEWKTNREQALESPERNDPTEDTPEPTEAGREKMSHVPEAPKNDREDLQSLAEQYVGVNRYIDLEELLEESRKMINDGYKSSTTNLILDAKDNLLRRVAIDL